MGTQCVMKEQAGGEDPAAAAINGATGDPTTGNIVRAAKRL